MKEHRNDVANIFRDYDIPDRTEENRKWREKHPQKDYSINLNNAKGDNNE